MIGRIRHGWTTADNADPYERLLRGEIFPAIAAKEASGYRGIQLFRRGLASGDVEFITIMWFDSGETVKRFAGDDYERAVVPATAPALLARYDARSQHYEIKEQLSY